MRHIFVSRSVIIAEVWLWCRFIRPVISTSNICGLKLLCRKAALVFGEGGRIGFSSSASVVQQSWLNGSFVVGSLKEFRSQSESWSNDSERAAKTGIKGVIVSKEPLWSAAPQRSAPRQAEEARMQVGRRRKQKPLKRDANLLCFCWRWIMAEGLTSWLRWSPAGVSFLPPSCAVITNLAPVITSALDLQTRETLPDKLLLSAKHLDGSSSTDPSSSPLRILTGTGELVLTEQWNPSFTEI